MDSTSKFFSELTPKARQNWRQNYQKLIDIEEDRLIYFTNKLGHKVKYRKMPWMLNGWKKGLEILEAVMVEKKELFKDIPYEH